MLLFTCVFLELTRPAASMRAPSLIYLSTSTDGESCSTRPISTNPGSMEAGEYGLTRGMRFVARRPEVVAGSPGCCGVRVVCFGWDGFFRVCVCVCVCVCVFFSFFFPIFFLRTHGRLQV